MSPRVSAGVVQNNLLGNTQRMPPETFLGTFLSCASSANASWNYSMIFLINFFCVFLRASSKAFFKSISQIFSHELEMNSYRNFSIISLRIPIRFFFQEFLYEFLEKCFQKFLNECFQKFLKEFFQEFTKNVFRNFPRNSNRSPSIIFSRNSSRIFSKKSTENFSRRLFRSLTNNSFEN